MATSMLKTLWIRASGPGTAMMSNQHFWKFCNSIDKPRAWSSICGNAAMRRLPGGGLKQPATFGSPSLEIVDAPLMQKLSPFIGQCRNKSKVHMPYAPTERRNKQDHYRRLLVNKYELERKLYKATWKNENLPMEIREEARVKLANLPRNSSLTRIRNRCIFSGRPRAVYRKFRMSRIVFRELARANSIMGIKKASW
eukprot:TRINITY_DN3965_c0_g1_i1.p1 TRINITY_DN3965_c0_g1~~TRINITY_DN3965_c0_g1_i1.p1  ORF type:complete len:197 (+),score=38.17 TRINITY_DN3965_c0_g1_i1:206-796(+)